MPDTSERPLESPKIGEFDLITSKKTSKKSQKKAISADNKESYRDVLISKLTGRTLMSYFVILNKGKIGVRELQRQLGLSSPSVSRYHLDKLVELGLVANQNGIYVHIKKADLPILASWVLVGKYLLPRMVFVAVFSTILLLGYLIFIYRFMNPDAFFVILFGILICGYSWFDVGLQLKHRPV
jgi:DNA-binding transcriptional ArsR family regulator